MMMLCHLTSYYFLQDTKHKISTLRTWPLIEQFLILSELIQKVLRRAFFGQRPQVSKFPPSKISILAFSIFSRRLLSLFPTLIIEEQQYVGNKIAG